MSVNQRIRLHCVCVCVCVCVFVGVCLCLLQTAGWQRQENNKIREKRNHLAFTQYTWQHTHTHTPHTHTPHTHTHTLYLSLSSQWLVVCLSLFGLLFLSSDKKNQTPQCVTWKHPWILYLFINCDTLVQTTLSEWDYGVLLSHTSSIVVLDLCHTQLNSKLKAQFTLKYTHRQIKTAQTAAYVCSSLAES